MALRTGGPGSTGPRRPQPTLHGRSGPPPPRVCAHAFYASVPRCSALTRGLLFHPLAVLARSGVGALRGWGRSPDVLAPVSPICDAVAGVCGDGLT